LVENRLDGPGRQSTAYHLTLAGRDLSGVIRALWIWGEAWAFGDPTPAELDPVLLMWWMRRRAEADRLPPRRVVVQFDFHGFEFRGFTTVSFWLILTRAGVTLCLTDPGDEIQVLVTADLTPFYRWWAVASASARRWPRAASASRASPAWRARSRAGSAGGTHRPAGGGAGHAGRSRRAVTGWMVPAMSRSRLGAQAADPAEGGQSGAPGPAVHR
jgi:hypothetical protein